MTQTETVLTIEHVTQTHLAQIVAPLFVVAALCELGTRVRGGDVGVEIRGVNAGSMCSSDEAKLHFRLLRDELAYHLRDLFVLGDQLAALGG